MTREEFYKLTDILSTDVLGNFMHGGEADELIAMFEEVVEHSNILEQEEPVNEKLEEAANNALNNVLNTHEIVNIRSCLEMFRFGSNWKEQRMMANAIDAEVLENYDGKVIKYDDAILNEKLSNCKVFDKVKVIVIKED